MSPIPPPPQFSPLCTVPVLQIEADLLGEEESRGRQDCTAHPDGGDDTHGNTPGQLPSQRPHYDLTQDGHQAQYMLTRGGSLFLIETFPKYFIEVWLFLFHNCISVSE